jgi:glycosyltransferase involved in cell wall biosynthesis
MQAIAARMCCMLIVPCEEDRQAYIKRGYPEERVVVFPLCLDFSLIPDPDTIDRIALRRRLGLDPVKTLLLYTGNRNERPYYQVAEWICTRLAPELAARYDDKFMIILTGAGPKLPAPEQVIFTGFVDNFVDYLMVADICLFPVWFEMGMAGKMVEYIAAGKPVVTTTLARGFPHLVDNVNVMAVETEGSFFQRTIRLIQEVALREAIGMRAREVALLDCSICSIAPQLIKVITEAVDLPRHVMANAKGVYQ